jgi:hypothetical protein
MTDRVNLLDMSDDDLRKEFGRLSGGSLDFAFYASELNRRAALRVADEVRKFNKCSTFLAVRMIALTIGIGVLTAFQVYFARLAH